MIDRRADGSRVEQCVDGPREEEEENWDFAHSSSSGTSLSVIASSSSECEEECLLDPTRVLSSATVSVSDLWSTSELVLLLVVVVVGDGKTVSGEPNGSRLW